VGANPCFGKLFMACSGEMHSLLGLAGNTSRLPRTEYSALGDATSTSCNRVVPRDVFGGWAMPSTVFGCKKDMIGETLALRTI